MTGKEMLTEVLLSLQKYLLIVDSDFDEKLIIDEDLNGAIAQLRTHGITPIFDDFLKYLSALITEDLDHFLSDPYPDAGTIHIIDFSLQNLDKKNRAFSYADTHFSFFSAKSLIDLGVLVDFSNSQHASLWKQMQSFFERDFNLKQSFITSFFDCLSSNNVDRGFVVKYIGDVFEPERHYSYIYLSFLNNSNSVKLPSILNYSSRTLNPALTFTGAIGYEQYFDIYDVLNELNQAPDLLTRFLKLYHVLEYFMYRVYLVDLVDRVGRNKFFVREFIGSAERMKAGERETFIKNFDKIFGVDITIIEAAIVGFIDPTVTTFLNTNGLAKSFIPSNSKKIAELIYGIRCAVVHNKESEYHLTVSFYDDFIQIIPLIRELSKIMENLIIEKIKTNHTNITYPQREVTLF